MANILSHYVSNQRPVIGEWTGYVENRRFGNISSAQDADKYEEGGFVDFVSYYKKSRKALNTSLETDIGGLSPEKQVEIALAQQREKEFTERLQEVEVQRKLSAAQAKSWLARLQMQDELEKQGLPSRRYSNTKFN